MFHRASEIKYLDGTSIEVRCEDGFVKRFDLSVLFEKYPQLKALRDRELFLQGKLMGSYGIIWNDELDLEVETVYEEGETVRKEKPASASLAGHAVSAARAQRGLSQKELAALSGIDQSDISKIERGVSNPSVSTMERIAKALGGSLSIDICFPTAS